jgi:predicted thioredoxin/glutaredoxin
MNKVMEVLEVSELVIYVHDNCKESLRALDIASIVKTLLPKVRLKVVNIDRENVELPEDFEGPVYVFNGELLKVGNPDPEQLISFLKLFEKSHMN